MNKPFPKSKACAAKTLFAIMKEMQKRGGSIPSKEINSFIENNVPLTEWEKERAGKVQNYRWIATTQFYSIDYKVAGFIIKKNGHWYITPEGEDAIKLGEEKVMEIANAAYHKWSAERKESEEDNPSEDIGETAKDILINLEELEGKAMEGITDHINSKNPYEFQELVAALLRAMGYYTPFIAPRGKDGGIDIIAYLDPLGAKEPRIKVQVKHKPDTAIPAKDIRALVGTLKSGDIGLFVTSGTFSPDARRESGNSKEYVRIIDGAEFIELWQDFYDKMPDEDKNRLPLKRIAFIGLNEQ